MIYEQLNWIRNASEDNLAQIALKLAATDWNLFVRLAQELHMVIPEKVTNTPKYTTKPTNAEGVNREVMDGCIRAYGNNENKVVLVRYLREMYDMDLKEAVNLANDLIAYWSWQNRD